MLLERVVASGARSVAVVGLAKNSGKTVTLNSLISQATTRSITLGLTSLGYDGERMDRLALHAKPTIAVVPGTVVATAQATLERATASLELLQISNYPTALGPIILARVREAGTVELAGPGSLSDFRHLATAMHLYGASLVLIDGALNRLGSAAPRVSQAAILATGASVAVNPEQIVARTLHALALLTAAPPPPAVAEVARTAFAIEQIAYWHPERGAWSAAQASALGRPTAILAGLAGATHLCLPGAVTDSLVQALLQQLPAAEPLPTLVVPTGTHVFATPQYWQQYLVRGGSLAALESTPVLAVTVHPGDWPHLGATLARALHPLPVYDLLRSGNPL